MQWVCGVAAEFGDGRTLSAKLPIKRPTFRFDASGGLPRGFTASQVEDVLLDAFNGVGGWAEVCDVELDKHINPKTNPTNLVIVHDLGTGGILADQLMPLSAPPLRMRINSRVDWCVAVNPPRGKVDLLRTLRHEWGHFLGLSHFPLGGPPELMEPRISDIIAVQPTEAAFAAKLYGEPIVAPGPLPPGAVDEIAIEALVLRTPEGKRYSCKGVAKRQS